MGCITAMPMEYRKYLIKDLPGGVIAFCSPHAIYHDSDFNIMIYGDEFCSIKYVPGWAEIRREEKRFVVRRLSPAQIKRGRANAEDGFPATLVLVE